ncbi:T-box transcription factor TBX22 [Puntigrus tetrazona]|uniref:T-box transcription factor TBX22 n=1 Tax=Puntigrus tetrazona TaxID=1606681 RepID=UPI001C8A5EF0|nr:T-box transcription factor TBX22 [Puntigrus tetrazona]
MQALSTDTSGETFKKMRLENMKNEKFQCFSDYDRDAPTAALVDTQDQRNKKKKSMKSSRPAGAEGEAARHVGVDLQGYDLWKRFHEIGTEMIITKAGRRMFPSVRVKVHNLDPDQQYSIAMDIVPVDSKRYRYVYHSSQWMVSGNTDQSCVAPRLCVHPDSPSSGQTWMRQLISFDRVKLTNNEMDDKGHIILKSMHKYRPRIHVVQHRAGEGLSETLPADGVHSFSFSETQFTTVTAYQNQQITKLKIDRNPFAKGFRERNGVPDGMLESYAWPSPLNLDFRSFAVELQGRCGGSPAAVPVTFSRPPCCSSVLSYRTFCSICLGRLCAYGALQPVLDLSFTKAERWLQDSGFRSASAGWGRAQKDDREPGFASPYIYRFPRFSSVTRHLKQTPAESLFTNRP